MEQTWVTATQYIISLCLCRIFLLVPCRVSVQIFYDSARCCPSAGRCHNWGSYRNKICQHCHCQHIFEWILWKLTKILHRQPNFLIKLKHLAVGNFRVAAEHKKLSDNWFTRRKGEKVNKSYSWLIVLVSRVKREMANITFVHCRLWFAFKRSY